MVKFLVDYLKKVDIKNYSVDHRNNVVVPIKGKSDKTIMIDAHLDQIGFIVSNVDNNGIISIQPLGYGDVSILSARHLTILGENKNVNAVIDRKHSHLVDDEEDESIEKFSDAFVDIGIRDRQQVLKHVKIGDPGIFTPSFNHLMSDYYCGDGFDNKLGCFVLLELIRKLIRYKKVPEHNLLFTFSSREELGCLGAKELAHKYNPDLFIGVDVIWATDYFEKEEMEREVGRCELGKGVGLLRGVNIFNPALKIVEEIANKNGFKVQYQVTTGEGTNAADVANVNEGIRILDFGIPIRNMHTSVETVNFSDIKTSINLLYSFLSSKKLKNLFQWRKR